VTTFGVRPWCNDLGAIVFFLVVTVFYCVVSLFVCIFIICLPSSMVNKINITTIMLLLLYRYICTGCRHCAPFSSTNCVLLAKINST